jgi:UDP-N-acetyl-D-glucosamine dehydrogenase
MVPGFDELFKRIEGREAVIGVIGLGYVGLPVAVTFAEGGFTVIGVDLNELKVDAIDEGRSFLGDVADEQVAELRASGRLSAASSFDALSDADAVLICVPTPITQGAPDLSLVVSAGTSLGEVLKKGSLVVLESTTYPGSTEELLSPLLEGDRYKVGQDFLLAFSPERIDPGNPVFSFSDIPKIVGGVDETSTQAAAALYGKVVPKVVTVSGAKEAELAKLIENTFRHVNIALVNELAVYAHDMGIDIWEAIEAAASKPFGFMPFWPGPGWGGHCIPLDPAYLSWRVRQDRSHEIRFVEVAQAVNSEMPRYVAERVSLMLNEEGRSVRGAKILAIGVAYKPGVDDTREAGALKVIARMSKQGATVSYHDPLVPSVEVGGSEMSSVELTPELLAEQDLVVVLVAQVDVDWEKVATKSHLVLDCCNALKRKGGVIHRL